MAPVDGGGNVTRPGSPLPVTGQTADAPQVNVPVDDIYAVLNQLAFLDGRKSLRGNIPMNGYRAVGAANAEGPQDYVTLSQLQSILATFGVVPTGAIMPLTGTTVPAGYVRANGVSLLRATFPNLWTFAQSSGNLAASEGVKTAGQYGPGDGSTTFTLPNLEADNGYFIRPMGGGRTIGSVQADDNRWHSHTASVNDPGHFHTPSGTFFVGGSRSGKPGGGGSLVADDAYPTSIGRGYTGITVSILATGGSETRPKNVAYPWIIKA